MLNKPYILGICGGSGSGKTTFVKSVLQSLSADKVCVISMDNYYKPKKDQPKDKNGLENYDLPESINIAQMIPDLQKVLNGEVVEVLEYNFNNPKLIPRKLKFEYKPIIIIEGVFLYHYEELKTYFDLKIFIDTQEHLRITRRLARDLVERNYSVDQTLYYIENHVIPGYKKFIEPYIEESDIIVPNNTTFENAKEVLVKFLKTIS